MNGRLLGQTLRWQSTRLAIVALVAVGWGWLMPFFYAQFSDVIRELAQQNPLFEQFSNFGSGNLLSVSGAMTIGFQHPLAIAMLGIFAVGATSTAVAGERQRGTLEVLLARPLPRRSLIITLTIGLIVAVAIVVVALLTGMTLGVVIQGLADEIDLGQLPLVALNGLLLWSAFATFGIAASVTFDRSGPAIGLSLTYLLVNYFLEILGTFWADAAWTAEYSLFHQFQPVEIFAGRADPADFAILAVATLLPFIYALIVFPRRDLAAPS